jgi:transcriptional regulator with XRE-family HTH domain
LTNKTRVCKIDERMKTEILDRKEIGKKLAQERESQHLAQADLAEKLGFDRRQIWQFENGLALTLENIAALSKFYNKPIEHFLEGEKS